MQHYPYLLVLRPAWLSSPQSPHRWPSKYFGKKRSLPPPHKYLHHRLTLQISLRH